MSMKPTKYRGVYKRKMADKTIHFFARFKVKGTDYGFRNFTKEFGCLSESETFDKLKEVKNEILSGKDPFKKSFETLEEMYEEHKSNSKWRENTIKNYDSFFNKHFKKFQKYKLEKIPFEDLNKIFDKLESSNQRIGKNILNPLLSNLVSRDIINKNFFDEYKLKPKKYRAEVTERVTDDNDIILKKLYKGIMTYKAHQKRHRIQTKYLYLFVLLSGKRYGEILKLTKNDIYFNINEIRSSEEITKSKRISQFPIPDELKEFFQNSQDGKLFNELDYGSQYMTFQRIVKHSNINLMNNKVFSAHDLRRVMNITMVRECGVDSALADYCLDHRNQNQVQKHYLHFTYDDKKEAFKKYWDYLRENIFTEEEV